MELLGILNSVWRLVFPAQDDFGSKKKKAMTNG